MSISLRNNRNRRRRRSYADYRPRQRNQGPGNDPLRIILYLILIAGGIWVYLNPELTTDSVRNIFAGEEISIRLPFLNGGTDGTPDPALITPQPEIMTDRDLAEQASEAVHSGDFETGIDLYRQAAVLAPNNVDYPVEVAHLLLYQSAMAHGETREQLQADAEDAANSAILADPFSPKGYAILGKIQDWQGKPEEALTTLLRAIELDNTYPEGQSYYAEAQLDVERWDQALETIEYALELAPDNVHVRRDYAYILESLADYEGASTQYEAALAIEPNFAFLKMALARTYRQVGRNTEAIDTLFDLQVLYPNNALIQYEIGRTYETYIGDPNTALEYFEAAVNLADDFTSAWLRIGTLRYQQGSYSQAIPALERALEGDAGNPEVYLQLGLSYANQNQCDRAIPYLMQAQQEAPDNEIIQEAALSGFDICQQPTPDPASIPTATAQPTAATP